MHSVTYAICMLGIHVLSSQASVDFQHTLTGASLVRRAALPNTVHGYDLRPPEHYCAADATACTWYLQPCQDARRSPPVLTASGPNCFRRLAAYVGPNRSSVDKDTNRSVSQHRHDKRSDAHSEHSTPRRPRVQRPKRPGHNTHCAINVHSAPARTHSWRTPPAASPKGSTPALSSNLRANLVAGCRILHSCAGLSRCDNEPCLTMHSCQPTCQADWRVPPTPSATGLMLTLWADQINAGRYSLLNRSGVCGPTGHSAGNIRYLSLRSIQHICQAYWRTPPIAHQPGARSVLRTLLIARETPLSATIRQVWQKQATEDQLPTNRCYLLESVLPGGDPWTRQNPSISYLGKLLSRVIICNFVQLSARSRMEHLTKQEQWQRAMALLDPPYAHDARLALQIARQHATQIYVSALRRLIRLLDDDHSWRRLWGSMERALAQQARSLQDQGLPSVHAMDWVDSVRRHSLRTTTIGRQLRLICRGLSLVDQCQVLWCLHADIADRPTLRGYLPVYHLPGYSSSSSSCSSTSEAIPADLDG